MSQLRVCLFAFLVSGVVVAGFVDFTKDKGDYNKEVTPNSECTRLTFPEQILKAKLRTVKSVKEKLEQIFGKSENNSSCFGNITSKLGKIRLNPLGLLWCGPGSRAKHDKDLGSFNETDACCRTHDKCKNSILAGKALKNLKNDGFFTRSACTCDNAFYNCLKDVCNSEDINLVHKKIAEKVGLTYFNALGPQCFRCSCATDKCKEDDDTECKGCCDRYEWVDNRKF